jgi:hypothetical protein
MHAPQAEAAAVTARLNYLVPTGEKPASYTYEPPAGTPWRTGRYEAREVTIRDARPLIGRLSLDREGFEFVRRPTRVVDFYDEGEVRQTYYPEVERLVLEATGAEKAIVFDHTLRSGALAQRRADGLREAVKRVHNDYTETSGPQRVRDLLPPEEAERRLRGRFAFVNVWRPIRGPIEEAPLALADARSMRPEDLVASDLIYRDRVGETYAIAHNPAHRWFYFPRMQRDEAILIKCYDSARDGAARWSAHTAFDDPNTPASAAPRESIEVRTIVFWPARAG